MRLLACLIVAPQRGYDEPAILSYAISSFCPTSADGLQSCAEKNGEFSAAQLRDRLDNGRKVAIQILEFFDRHGVVLRRGDMRRINRHRLDLFRRPAEGGEQAQSNSGRESSLVGRPDFKSGRGREPVFGGFDSHSLPPASQRLPR